MLANYGSWLAVFLIVIDVYYLLPRSRILRHGKRLKLGHLNPPCSGSPDTSHNRSAPNTLPLVGNGLYFLQARHKLFAWFVRCEALYGLETFEISVPTLPPGVVIHDPNNVAFVLKHEDIFSKGQFVRSRAWDLFGYGIINADEDLWKVQRKAGLHFLNTANLKVLTEVALPTFLEDAVQFIRSHGDDRPIDLEELFLELTTQLMGRMAYNMDMHITDAFSVSFDHASGMTGERFQNPLWPITELLFGQRFRRSLATVKAFGHNIVASAVQTRDVKDSGTTDSNREGPASLANISGSLIYSLLDAISDHQIVADAALNYLSAGRDTTAQALTWTFYLLLRHGSSLSRVRKEVSAQADVSASMLPTPQTHPYTLAVFYEALRFYPPVPIEIKQATSSTTLPDGTLLPASSVLVIPIWSMNRSSKIWGTDAETFRPDRWLDKDGRVVGRSAWEFPVFNGGPRTCLGRKMAEQVAVVVLARLTAEFDFTALDDKERRSRNSLTLPMEGGLPVYVKNRHER